MSITQRLGKKTIYGWTLTKCQKRQTEEYLRTFRRTINYRPERRYKGALITKGEAMASNFRIYCHQNSDNLHLKLLGDFDGTSAYELIRALEKYQGNGGKVFIHTCALSSVHPFGLEVFQKNCSIKKLSQTLTFTGEYGTAIAPQGSNAL